MGCNPKIDLERQCERAPKISVVNFLVANTTNGILTRSVIQYKQNVYLR